MAGFSCDAQRRYRIGEPQNVFGTAAAIVIVVVELGDREVKVEDPWSPFDGAQRQCRVGYDHPALEWYEPLRRRRSIEESLAT